MRINILKGLPPLAAYLEWHCTTAFGIQTSLCQSARLSEPLLKFLFRQGARIKYTTTLPVTKGLPPFGYIFCSLPSMTRHRLIKCAGRWISRTVPSAPVGAYRLSDLDTFRHHVGFEPRRRLLRRYATITPPGGYCVSIFLSLLYEISSYNLCA